MSTQEILAELPKLSAEELQLIMQAARELEQNQSSLGLNGQGQRVAGAHRGAWTIPDDFDEPLPDEFWFGKEE